MGHHAPRTVRELVDEYRRRRANEHNLKRSTVTEYERHLLALVEQCGGTSLREFTDDDVRDFLSACPRGSLPSRYSLIAALLRWADRLHPGLADLLPQRKPERRWRTRHLSGPEVRRIVAWIAERRTQPRARPATLDAVEFAIVCPLRRGEIVSLQAHEVDLEGARLFLHDTKSGNRVVPMSPVARMIARRRMLSAPESWLFPARARRGHMLAESLSHAWARIAKACRLGGVPFHCLRHTWASQALRAGISLEYVRRVMGHSTEWMAVKYAHVACSELQRAVDDVELALIGGCDDA